MLLLDYIQLNKKRLGNLHDQHKGNVLEVLFEPDPWKSRTDYGLSYPDTHNLHLWKQEVEARLETKYLCEHNTSEIYL